MKELILLGVPSNTDVPPSVFFIIALVVLIGGFLAYKLQARAKEKKRKEMEQRRNKTK